MTRKLRSQAWFGGVSKDAFIHRSWMKNGGLPDDAFDGRPVIGICNTFSDLTPCNAHFRELAAHVKAGVLEAGGLPLEFPVFSCGESNLRPTAMLFRNLAAMDVEEAIRGNPLDGVVLMAGCDKTTPALLMGAASCDLPAILISGGPMLNGKFRGRDIGSGTDVWKFSDDVRAGAMSIADFIAAESAMSRSPGHCMTMGTASSMAIMAESLGVTLPGNAAWPAVDARRTRLARLTGRRAVEIVREDLRLSRILTSAAFANAIRMNGAVGGSTNAVIHLLAIAGRIGVDLTLDDWDKLGRGIPTIVDLMPAGRYLMEDFCYAGGVPATMRRVADLLDLNATTITGRTLGENIADAVCCNDEVIRARDRPLVAEGGIAVLRGNLAPSGAVLKPSAASPELMRHRGRSVVFSSIEDYRARIDDPALEIDEVLRHGAAELRPEGLSRNGRGREHGAPPQAARTGRARHGAHLGCAHVRHGVRHRRPARRPRGGGGGAAGARARWRHHRPQRRRATSASRRPGGRIGGAPRRLAAPAGRWRRLSGSLRAPCAAGRSRRRLRFPGREPRPRSAA